MVKEIIQRLLLCLIFFSLLFSCAYPKTMKKEHESSFDPLSSIVHLYRGPLNHLSAVRRGLSPMYPCSSSYSLQCLKKHGPFIGWMITCDRLMRSGRDELDLSPWIKINGKWWCYDPVENNDFWWYKK
jgi:putative component of membrane protein insertase Oxa1/YidC/SpoIIIJ protein YidD